MLEETFRVVPRATRGRFAVGENAAFGVFGPERKVEPLDWLAAFIGEFGTDAAFVFEAAEFMASGATIMTRQVFALGGELRVIHVIRGSVRSIGTLLRHQVRSDIAGVVH